MQINVGRWGAGTALAATAGFSLCMMLGADGGAYLCSMAIALGFVPMICALAARAQGQTRAAGLAAVAFAAAYALACLTVYFIQLTTVPLLALDGRESAFLDFQRMGLMFHLDMLGYALMSLSTLMAALSMPRCHGAARALKVLLLIHGLFAVTCLIGPLLGVFAPDSAGGGDAGVWVLQFWCLYFAPVCLLAFRYLKAPDCG